MFKIIALVIVAAVALVLIAAAFQPDNFRVARSAQINASAEKIHPWINNMAQMNTWNPFNKKDPAMKGSYRGPAAGPGAAFDFAGNNDVGTGSIEIVESTPSKITLRLDMRKPMEGSNTVVFSLQPRGSATEVTWSLEGKSPYLGKLMGMVFNMDKMVGDTFTTGLADLKTAAERG